MSRAASGSARLLRWTATGEPAGRRGEWPATPTLEPPDSCGVPVAAWAQASENTVDSQQTENGQNENQPARKEMEESLSILDPEPPADETGHYDATGVGDDRDRYHRGHQHNLHPESR